MPPKSKKRHPRAIYLHRPVHIVDADGTRLAFGRISDIAPHPDNSRVVLVYVSCLNLEGVPTDYTVGHEYLTSIDDLTTAED